MQVLVGQHVHEGREVLAAVALGRGQRGQQFVARIEHRQAMQAGPDALGGPFLEPHAPARIARQQHPQRLRRAPQLARLDRIALGRAFAPRHAAVVDRAQHAARLARQADGGAEVHLALRVARDRLAVVGRRQQPRRMLPEQALAGRRGQVLAEAQHARQHALHVAVEDGHALAEAEGRDGRGGGTADAGQGRQFGGRLRKAAAEARHHLLRAAVHVARAAVVAESAPQAEDFVLGAFGQRPHVGKAFQEAREIAEHGRDLRLLQHHLRQPHAVGIARVLPRQLAAAMAALPGDHALGEVRREFQGDGRGSLGAAALARARGNGRRHAVLRPRHAVRRPRPPWRTACPAARSAR